MQNSAEAYSRPRKVCQNLRLYVAVSTKIMLPPGGTKLRGRMKVLFMTMKLTFILLTIALLNASAAAFSQTVTYKGKDVSLKTVFAVVKQQTGYTVFGNKDMFAQAQKVTVTADHTPLKDFLDNVFIGQPLTYHIDGKTIFISNKPIDHTVKPLIKKDTSKPGADFTALVINLQSEAMINATVVLKRTGKGVITDVKGRFVMKDVKMGDVLTISYIGYKTTTHIITELSDQVLLLEPTDNSLDQVIIQGYGKTTRRSTTGNIVKITSDEILRNNNMNPMLALVGKVPGLVVTPQSGFASSSVRFELRGRKGIGGQFVADPLFIIDGVPIMNLEMGSGNYETGSTGVTQGFVTGPGGGQSPFFSLDPNEIESIEVLKDADATAIYGSRGANGVILITTKRSKENSGTQLNFNIAQGVSMITREFDLLNTPEYVQIRKEALANDGLPIDAINAPDLVLWDTTRYTNWQKKIWGNWAHATRANMTLSGGNMLTQFRLNGSFERQTEVNLGSEGNKRGGVSLSVTHTSINNRFRANATASYMLTDVGLSASPGNADMAPNSPSIYNKDGSLNFEEWMTNSRYETPFAVLKQQFSNKTGFLRGSMNFAYELARGLNASINFGYNNSKSDAFQAMPIAAQNPIFNPTGYSFSSTTNSRNLIVEPQLNYNTTLGKGRLSALLGGTWQSTQTDVSNMMGFGFTSDDLIHAIQNAPVQSVTQVFGEYKYAAVFARLSYSLHDRYYFNLNARRDGSSRFGADNRFGNFGSAGAAWIVSGEKWMQSWLPKSLSLVKLRGSYGIVGSDNVGDYQYMAQWSSMLNGNILEDYDGKAPLTSLIAVNPSYHWQANKKFEASLSLGFLNDRISLDASYYNERCDNQLTQFPIALMTGFSNVTANWPANVENSGWEFTLNGAFMERENFRWTGYFNIGINKNKLIAYPGIEESPYYTVYKVGQSLNTKYLLHSTGVDPQTGYYSFEDRNKDGVIDMTTGIPGEGVNDRYIPIDLSPKYLGGFGTGFRYKNFDLNLAFNFRRQYGIDPSYGSVAAGSLESNQSRELLGNYWQKPGDVKKFQRLTTISSIEINELRESDAYYQDITFVRLNNVALSYTLPSKWLAAMKLKTCRLYLQAQNVFVITNYKGLDPEIYQPFAIPPVKSFVGGLSIQL
ncbi:SusC/RagA family TonB-linked outer membrane protein [Chitinophaga caeni]|nr:SusC/RagA family TonB-linked outer membrane protein [Chitinophaga caeni]